MKYILATLLVFTLNSALADTKTKKFRAEISGSTSSTQIEVDSAGTIASVGVSHTAGKGSFGKYEATGHSRFADWDGSSFCNFDENGKPTGVEIYATNLTLIQRYEKGSILAFEANTSNPGTLCADFNEPTFTYSINYVVAGGTGRFEGATGSMTSNGTGQFLDLGASFVQAKERGLVTFIR